jgi:hypothetical protein
MSNSSGSATVIAGNGKVVTELLDREVDAKVLKSAINGAVIEGGSFTGRTVTSTLRISPSPVPSLAFIVIKSFPLKLRFLCTNIMHFFIHGKQLENPSSMNNPSLKKTGRVLIYSGYIM